jgi:predicted nucleic acid-binding protein
VIVVDTDVVSEIMRPAPEPIVVAWLRIQDGRDLYTTSITVAEILYGLERLPAGRRRQQLEASAREVFVTFADHVVVFDVAAATEYAVVASARERTGAPIGGFDAQIAAICRVHDATLATRNLADFDGTGIDMIDPWARA